MDGSITMFRYELKLSDYVAICILVILCGVVYASIHIDVPYNWKWDVVWDYFVYIDEQGKWHINLLAQGTLNTLRLFIYTMIVAVPLSFVLVFMRMSGNMVISTIAMLYINFVRNVAVLVFLFVFYFFISEQIFPILELKRDLFSGTGLNYILFGEPVVATNIVAGFICLGLFESVFFAEIIRGAIQSIPQGQYETSKALRLSKV